MLSYPAWLKTTCLLGLSGLLLPGCASHDPYQRTKGGAVAGAVLGAVIGNQMDRTGGAAKGAVIGGMLGAGVGNYMDRQEQEMLAAMEAERRAHEIEIERLEDESLKLSLNNEVSFDFDQADIKPSFEDTLNKLADILQRYPETSVTIIGHTDDRGSESYNLRLSERRAEAVADYLRRQGVEAWRLRTEGRGEYEPRESNATEAGRQLNRRVEVIIRPR